MTPAVCSPKSMVNGRVRRTRSHCYRRSAVAPTSLECVAWAWARSQPRSQPETDRQDNVATRRLRSPASRLQHWFRPHRAIFWKLRRTGSKCSCWPSSLSFLGEPEAMPWAPPNANSSSATPAVDLRLHTPRLKCEHKIPGCLGCDGPAISITLSNTFGELFSRCCLAGDKFTCSFRTRTDGLNAAIRQQFRKKRRPEAHAGLIRSTKLCFTPANEVEYPAWPKGRCPRRDMHARVFL